MKRIMMNEYEQICIAFLLLASIFCLEYLIFLIRPIICLLDVGNPPNGNYYRTDFTIFGFNCTTDFIEIFAQIKTIHK